MNCPTTTPLTASGSPRISVVRKLAMSLFFLGLIVAGCTTFELDPNHSSSDGTGKKKKKLSILDRIGRKQSQSDADTTSAGLNKKIRWDGSAVVLGETGDSVFSAQSFVETVSELVTKTRSGTIKTLVQTYPDISLKALQETAPTPQNLGALQAIAANFDRIWCQSGNPTWEQYIEALGQIEERDYVELKNQFWLHLKNHLPEKALALKIAKSMPSETSLMMAVEVHRLEAVAYMLQGNFDQAIEQLQKSISLASTVSPYQAHQLELLLGEFHRHAGNLEAWKETWQLAVEGQSELVASQQLLDPSFWEQAAYLRPTGLAWSTVTISNLNYYLASLELLPANHAANILENEATIWLVIGFQHMTRNEGQNAILAFKKSEAATGNQQIVSSLHLFQARAFVNASQPGPASAMLFRLIADKSKPLIADRAKAVLGAMKIQNGAIGQGVNLLQSAIKTAEQWPRSERLRAQADYALAMLVKGNEAVGLPLLDQVHQEFKAIGEFEQAQQCLWNKATYFERTDQKEPLLKAQAELAEFENELL